MSIRSLLEYETLGALEDQTSDSLTAANPTPLWDMCYQNPEPIDNDEYIFRVAMEERRLAPLNSRNTSPHILQPQDLKEKRGGMFHVFNESAPFDMEYLRALANPDDDTRDAKGAREIRRQVTSFQKRHRNLKELITAKMLFKHKVYIQSNGNVDPADSAGVAVDFGVSANHRSQLNGIIAASWATASTKILTQIDNLFIQANKEKAPAPKYAICNSSVKARLRANTEFQTWASNHGVRPENILTGADNAFEGFGNLNWMFIDHWYDSDGAGTMANFIPDDTVLFIPEPSMFLKPVVGWDLVPTKVGVTSSVEEALASCQEVYGEFTYAEVSHKPLKLSLIHGDHFGYAITNENAIWTATVVF